MREIFKLFYVILFTAIFSTGIALPNPAQEAPKVDDAATHRLELEIGRAEKLSGGTAGVSAVHLESGHRIGFNSKERFPMASTYKVPIAVQFLTRVDRGEVSLERMVAITPRDLHPGSGILTELLSHPGVILSARNLLELMLVVSDNSAADLLLELAGGPGAVTARMRELDITEMDINRPTVLLLADAQGYPLPPEDEWTPGRFQTLFEGTTAESRKEAARKFEMDSRDTSTPEAMVKLFEKLHRREILKKESNALLLGILARVQTGKSRIQGLLVPEIEVAHKTGTLGATANDAGIVTLPDQGGHVAIAVFLKSSPKEVQDREKAIAHIARSVYDYFLFRSMDSSFKK